MENILTTRFFLPNYIPHANCKVIDAVLHLPVLIIENWGVTKRNNSRHNRIEMKLGLSIKQQKIFDTLLSYYDNQIEFTGKIIFTKNSAYIPPRFYYSQTHKNLTAEELLQIINTFSTSVRQHDGFVFISPDGTAMTGGILDATELVKTFPKRINESTAAGAFMKLVTQFDKNYVKCAVICTCRVSIFYEGKEKNLYKFAPLNIETAHNYGIGVFVSDKVPNNNQIRLIEMKGFRKTPALATTEQLINTLLTIAYDYYRHDGFWQYNPIKKTLSGPFLVVTKTHPDHLEGTGGMKRLTAKLLAHNTRSVSLILREGSSELQAFGEIDKEVLVTWQNEINRQILDTEPKIEASVETSSLEN